MNIEIKKGHPIDISFESNTAPTINVDSKNKVEATLEKKDFNYHLHKHPELGIFFETKVIAGSSVVILSQEEWDALPTKNNKTIYLIVNGDELEKLYIGNFLIAQRGENGFFPYTFPIIF